MAKTLLYRLFGIGKFPWELASTLKVEGILLMDEGIPGSATYLNFHSPGRYARWRRQWYTTAIAITEVRLLALLNGKPIVNVPLADERIHKLEVTVEKKDTLCVAFDPSLFHDDWSGRIEYRFRTPQAQAFLNTLRERLG